MKLTPDPVNIVGQCLPDIRNLAGPRLPLDLQRRLGYTNEPPGHIRIGPEQPPRGVYREPAAHGGKSLLDQIGPLTRGAKSQLLHPQQLVKGAHIADLRHLDLA
jgi:hypothetical protein